MPWPTLSTERQVEVTCQYMACLNAETISLIEAAFREDRFPDFRIPNPAPEAPPVLVVDNHGNYHHPTPTPGDVPADGRGPESAPEQPQAAVDRRGREVRGGDKTSPPPRRGRDDVDTSTPLPRRCSSAPAVAPTVGAPTNPGGGPQNRSDSSPAPPAPSQTPSNRKRQVDPKTVVRGGRPPCPRPTNTKYMGRRALHDINGLTNIVIMRLFRFSMVRVAITAGTLQPNPINKGINDLP